MEFELNTCWHGCRIVAALADGLEQPGVYEEALASVSDYRRSKVQELKFAKDRRVRLLAGLLLDELLREHGLRERDMTYVEGAQGKPAFASLENMHFSLAHSGRMAVAALSASPVGVDVEDLQRFPYDIAEPRSWTEMESVGKLIGCGVGAFVDGDAYRRPEGAAVKHVDLDGYLVCIAC